MARRTKAELISELERIYHCFDTMLDCINDHGPDDVAINKDEITQLSSYLRGIEDGEFSASVALSGVKEGMNENSLCILEWMEEIPDHATAVLNCYEAKTRREYWVDAGNPKMAIRAMLKRDLVENEVDYYLLKEVVIDTNSTLISKRDRAKANDLLAAFEAKQTLGASS